jgi:hypothetical protein
MTNARSFLVRSLFGVAAALAVACSSPSPSAPDSGPGPDISNIPTPPANVSFSSQVVPIFQQSCGTSGAICHGSTTVTTAMQPRPFLGLPFGTPSTQTLQSIHDGIVNTLSNEDPTMNYVTASTDGGARGDTSQSFLWFKVTGQEDQLNASCTNPAFMMCGLAMPYQGAPLTVDELSIVEGWIQQGALNN